MGDTQYVSRVYESIASWFTAHVSLNDSCVNEQVARYLVQLQIEDLLTRIEGTPFRVSIE